MAKGNLVGKVRNEEVEADPRLCCSSTKANGYSELGVKDKQGLIENELVSADDNN